MKFQADDYLLSDVLIFTVFTTSGCIIPHDANSMDCIMAETNAVKPSILAVYTRQSHLYIQQMDFVVTKATVVFQKWALMSHTKLV